MRILFNIGNPAHLHFFKNAIWILENKGIEVKIATIDKEVSLYLLNAYGFKYNVYGKSQKGMLKKAICLVRFDYNLYKIAKKFNPDILVSAGSTYAAHVSALNNRPHISFEDAEHTWGQHLLYLPFTDVVCTTTSFKKDFGKKHVRYDSFDELAYLHPKYFKPDTSVLDDLNLTENDNFIIIRFASWDASHDIGQYGFDFKSSNELHNFIDDLENYGDVLITSETKLPSSLEKYRLTAPPEKIHDLLYFAEMYIGEGATIAAEAAVLGTPSIYVSTIPLGYLDELRDKYGLVRTCAGYQKVLENALDILENFGKRGWKKRKEDMLRGKIDITKFIVDLIEDFPESVKKIKRSGDVVRQENYKELL